MTETVRTIEVEIIPARDPRLKRQIRHDSESRRYAFPTEHLSIETVEHKRILAILNQGQVGKCTAETGLGVLGTEPYHSQALADLFGMAFGSFDDRGSDRLYDAEEMLDGNGHYPPNDYGSSGLTLAKALRAAGLISGWTQTFSLDGFLKALGQYPVAVGTYWYRSMSHPARDGLVTVDFTSGIDGGHEYEAVGYDAKTNRVKFANSWGTSWGAAGYFHIDADVFGKLLGKKGDATVFTPATLPPPEPQPQPEPPALQREKDLYAALGAWAKAPHTGTPAKIAAALNAEFKRAGLS